MTGNIADLFIARDSSIRDAVVCIDRTAHGIALVVDADRRLLGTITDGDVRRAMLSGLSLDDTTQRLLESKSEYAPKTPTVALADTPTAELLDLMNRQTLAHIPLLDAESRVVDLAMLRDLVREVQLPMRALIMAGGYGTRLRPLTDDRPKSMLPIGDRPLLEMIVEQLQQAGIHHINVATHYKADIIERHFGDGKQFNVDIEYVTEDQPLGTAGALGLVGGGDEPILIINGDIVTQMNFAAMLEFHHAHAADMTVAVRPFDINIPYGVVSVSGVFVTDVAEKPVVRRFINAGIYLANGDVRNLIPKGEKCDMPQLIGRLLAAGRRIVGFPLREYSIDIGRIADYARAVADVGEGKV